MTTHTRSETNLNLTSCGLAVIGRKISNMPDCLNCLREELKDFATVKHTPLPWKTDGGSIWDEKGNVVAMRLARKKIDHKGDYFGDDHIDPVQAGYNARFITRACNAHYVLLAIAKKYHGWDDPLHIAAMPDCPECQAIAKAEEK